MKTPLWMGIDQDKIHVVNNSQINKYDLPGPLQTMVDHDLEADDRIEHEVWTDPYTREKKNISIVNLMDAEEHNALQEGFAGKYKIHTLDPLEQMYARYPDWYCQHANTNELKCLYFDIEVASDGGALFPKAERRPVLMIGYAVDDGETHIITVDDYTKDKENDYELIKEFIKVIEDEDPDLIVTYNGRRFDLPFLLKRAQMHYIDVSGLQRVSHVFDDVLAGRIHVDLYEDGAVRDMAPFMMGLPNRKMKTVAEAYNIEVGMDLDDKQIRNILGLWDKPEFKEKMNEYLISDVHITRELSKIYTGNLIAIADFNRVPLSAIVDTYKSFIPKLLCTRYFYEMKFTSFLTNKERHNPFNGTIAKARLGKPDTEEAGLVYEGAYVDIYKTGLFPNGIWKVDVESFYPSTFRTLNLSPETCSIEATREYSGNYKFQRDENNILWMNIPDDRIQKDIVIRIDMNMPGFLSQEIADALDGRFKLKHALRDMEKGTAEYIAIDGQQNALKVLLNSIYGLMGQSSSEYGSVACAIACVGMCRFIMKDILKDMMHCAVETDSVTGDTPVYVYDSRGLDIIPIEDLHNSNNKREVYSGPYEIYTRNGWKEIKYTKKHKITKPIHRIHTTDGVVDCTEDHSLFDKNGNPISPKTIHKNDIIEIVPHPDHTLGYGTSKDLAWLLGFFIAEGSSTCYKNKKGINQYQISFNGNDLTLMEKVERLATKHLSYFSKNNSPFKLYDTMKSSGVYKVEGGYNIACYRFIRSKCYSNNGIKKVPTSIINGTVETMTAFLEGYFVGDGTIKQYTNNGTTRTKISSCSISKPLSAGIQFLHRTLGHKTFTSIRSDKTNVYHVQRRIPRANGYTNINYGRIKHNNILDTNETEIYDVSTSDGTFVSAFGGVVLHNTDGIYVDEPVDIDEINDKIKQLLVRTIGEEGYIKMDMDDPYPKGLFIKMKNYILEDDKGNMSLHGATFKNAMHCAGTKKLLRELAKVELNGGKQDDRIHIMQTVGNPETWNLEDFVRTARFKREAHEYTSWSQVQTSLSEQLIALEGEPPAEGDSVEFIHTKEPWTTFAKAGEIKSTSKQRIALRPWITRKPQVDFQYYKGEADSILKRFGLTKRDLLEGDLSDLL